MFEGFLKMENAGNITVGNLRNKDDIMEQPEILKQAEDRGRKLSQLCYSQLNIWNQLEKQ